MPDTETHKSELVGFDVGSIPAPHLKAKVTALQADAKTRVQARQAEHAKIRALGGTPPRTTPIEVVCKDSFTPGMFLRIGPHRATWYLHIRHKGLQKHKLGIYPAVTLADARSRAGIIRATSDQGTDPKQAERDAEAARQARKREAVEARERTISALVERHIAEIIIPGHRQADSTARLLRRYVAARWHGRDIRTIAKTELSRMIAEIRTDRPALARRVRAHLVSFFNWAEEDGNLTTNPAVRLPNKSRQKPRNRKLDHNERRALWEALESGPDETFKNILKVMLLTGCRRREVSRAEWRHYDAAAGTLTIPTEHSKNAREHRVFLSRQAIEIIEGQPRLGKLIFGTNGREFTNWGLCKRRLDAALGVGTGEDCFQPWRTHDLRRSFATGWAALGVRVEVTEVALGHAQSVHSDLVRTYQQHEYVSELRAAAQLWADNLFNDPDHIRGAQTPRLALVVDNTMGVQSA